LQRPGRARIVGKAARAARGGRAHLASISIPREHMTTGDKAPKDKDKKQKQKTSAKASTSSAKSGKK
jgi:hypothetical protein